jgi:hypothetical protein
VKVLVMIDIATDRVEHRAAHGLQRPERDEEAGARCDAAQQRADREHREAGDEGALSPEPVRRGAREHQEAREHDSVGVDGPLQPGDAGVQLSPDRRQRDVHAGDVDPDDEEA